MAVAGAQKGGSSWIGRKSRNSWNGEFFKDLKFRQVTSTPSELCHRMSGAADGKVFGLAGALTFCGSLARPQVTQCCWSPVHWKRDDLMRPAIPAPSWCSTEAGPSRSYREPGRGELGKTWRPLFASGFITAHMLTVGLKGSWAKPHVRGSPKIHVSCANLSMA